MPIDSNQYIDIEEALGRVRGNKKIFLRMLGLFTKSTEFSAFEEHMAQKEYEKAGEVAHAIKGMTGNLGMKILFEESANLMVQLRQGIADEDAIARYRDAVVKTQAEVEKVTAELSAEG